MVVTSRQNCIQQPTLDWIDTYFPGVFQAVHFGNHWSLEGRSRPKSEICREIGAAVGPRPPPPPAAGGPLDEPGCLYFFRWQRQTCPPPASAALQVLIDDNPLYARECAAAGLQVLMFDWQLKYPWSKTADGPTHPNISRVQDWEEVEAALLSLAASQGYHAPSGVASGAGFLP